MTADASDALLTDAERVCDLVGTTLGPFGTNKLVVESGGRVTTTSSSALLLDRLELDDPATTLLREAAANFRENRGDGATSLVLLTGALLDAGVSLVDDGLHPTTVARGFRDALAVADDRLVAGARPLSLVGPAAVARSSLTGTRNPATRTAVGSAVAEAVQSASDAVGPARARQNVGVEARIGHTGDTTLVGGVVAETPPVSEAMPRRLPNAGVALLSATVDLPKLGGASGRTEGDFALDVDSFDDRAAIGTSERETFRRLLSAAVNAGCRFVATERAVNDRVETLLADHGVLAIERVEDEQMRRLARATGGTVVPTLAELTPETMGTADVRVERLTGREFVFVEGDAEPVYTVLCRAPDPRSVSAFEESVEGAVAATAAALEDERVVPGGGATELDLERAVRAAARTNAGREQLAMAAFADALVTVPRHLATTAGFDGWTGVIRLRVAHSEGRTATGVDALVGELVDVLDGENPIVEPVALKRDVIRAATELATQLLRIDEAIPATDLGDDDSPAGPAAVR